MLLGCSIPVVDIGSGPAVARDYAQTAEALGYSHLLAPDHVLGANPTPGQGVFAASAAVAASFNRDFASVRPRMPIMIRSSCSGFLLVALRRSASRPAC